MHNNHNNFYFKFQFSDKSDAIESTINGFEQVKIKTEPGLSIPETQNVKSEDYLETQCLFENNSKGVFVFQVAHTMPGQVEEDEAKANDLEDDSPLVTNKKKPIKLCPLENLEEGKIGKMIRYKSGKIKLFLGDAAAYDIFPAINVDYRQDAVSINANKEQRSASIYSLGEVQKQFHMSPDYEWLVDKIASETET
jgi:hypothetical protein